MMTPKVKEILGLLVFFHILHTSYAPFPEGHPYTFLNPLIEPWWNKISGNTQRQVLSAWKTVEPTAFALSRLVEAKMDLVAGRRRDGPPKPYPSERYGDDKSSEPESSPEGAGSESESHSKEDNHDEPVSEGASPEAESAGEPESEPSSFAY
ncbi:uncharacterized protein [Lepeophtheirus salmonis]|uniref:Uncharacterized protein n=2 Tax=Lepeophtheirus salmonis TaxID=72036 RepID=A7TZB9_LEPSM|nr:uncharacterized protein LOC121119201 [Lepeophtheirus salmonis]XP_040569757.1 uncharacterized protein LOC121119201 [Lepeophtheirus salmonis]XP_040569758.1 uncharacterized protein LOC121119201 [Lepeophtheirus salmonis]ABU41115.1 hypothetical protein [Lepeophtheirus salmonis]